MYQMMPPGLEYPANLIIFIFFLFYFGVQIIKIILQYTVGRKEILKIIAHTPSYSSIIKQHTLRQLQNASWKIQTMKSREFEKMIKTILEFEGLELIITLEQRSGIKLQWDEFAGYSRKRVLKDCIAFNLPLLDALRALVVQSELHEQQFIPNEDLQQLFTRFAAQDGNDRLN
ncbi:MAG: hypothetical protein RBG13Loki_3125 [Promethearchaeota archaeon CR_4]|nr:MAG: hypothetical protein RBG13Loki_3125 [Candidatus Lokiarchaeota archaeon CR_4]